MYVYISTYDNVFSLSFDVDSVKLFQKIQLICWVSEVQANLFKSQIFSFADFSMQCVIESADK